MDQRLLDGEVSLSEHLTDLELAFGSKKGLADHYLCYDPDHDCLQYGLGECVELVLNASQYCGWSIKPYPEQDLIVLQIRDGAHILRGSRTRFSFSSFFEHLYGDLWGAEAQEVQTYG